MNNLYRDLAPITEQAWEEIELEARRTFKRHIAGRRVVDVSESGRPGRPPPSAPAGWSTSSRPPTVCQPPARQQTACTTSCSVHAVALEIDNVERGSQDSDWDPVKDAAKKLAFVEDRAIFEGYSRRLDRGHPQLSSNPALTLPKDIREIPRRHHAGAVRLRLAGVEGPYSVLLSADVYTKVSETTEHGYPIREHIRRLVENDIIWAPAIDGAFVLTTRGGDFDLQLGTDVSIGYLSMMPRPCSCICRRR